MPTRHLIHRHPTLHGFTLIELLVVVTIIVILLALLTPALDKSIHMAELTVCGTTQSGVARGVVLYAGDHNRSYPARGGTVLNANYHANALSEYKDNRYDDRGYIKSYLSLNKQMFCPFIQKVDLENADATKDRIFASFKMYFGFSYGVAKQGDKGMLRMGDKWTWTPPPNETQYGGQRVTTLLVADMDMNTEAIVYGSHPDDAGVMTNAAWQHENTAFAVGLGNTADPMTQSWWWNFVGNPNRGMVDLNFAFADGSVRWYRNIPKLYKLPGPGQACYDDYNLSWVPEDSDYSRNDGTYRVTIPQWD